MQSDRSGLPDRPDSQQSKLLKLIGEIAKAKSLPCIIGMKEVKRAQGR
jgi:hypothetical protein